MTEELLVRDLMTTKPVTLPTDATIAQAAERMRSRGVGAVLVGDPIGLRGLLTDRDIAVRGLASRARPIESTTIGDICSDAILVVHPETSVDEALTAMKRRAIRRLPVLDVEGHIVGLITLGDILRRLEPDGLLAALAAETP